MMIKLHEQLNRMKTLIGLKENKDISSNYQQYFHGGNLDNLNIYDTLNKVGSNVYGIGLYLTTSRNIAERYAKGSRKLYVVEVDETSLKTYNDVDIKKDIVRTVFTKYLSKPKYNNLLKFLERINTLDVVNAHNLNIFLLNEKYINKNNISDISDFFKFQGIDGGIDFSPFGFNEKQLVLINLHKVKNIIKIDRNDSNYFDDFEYK